MTAHTVPGLRAADFVVREDGVQREVLRVRQDTEPLQIALLVDTSQAAARAIGDFRKGLRGFIDAMGRRRPHGHHRLWRSAADSGRLDIPSGRPCWTLADELFSSAGTAAYLLDALSETAEGFIKREASRPVMVVIATEGLDHSHSNVTSVLRTLEDAAITVQSVVLTRAQLWKHLQPRPRAVQSPERGRRRGRRARWPNGGSTGIRCCSAVHG